MSAPSPADAARRRMPADERRAAIIDAARAVFAERGFHGVSTAELAAAAGCSEPILYRHFASKQALFAAVLVDAGARMRARFDEQMAESDDPLGAFAARTCAAVSDPVVAQMVRLRSLAVALLDVPEIRDAVAASIAGFRGKALLVLEAARERGQVAPDIDLDAVAWTVVGISLVSGLRSALSGPEAVADMQRIQLQLMRLVQTDPAPATHAACADSPVAPGSISGGDDA